MKYSLIWGNTICKAKQNSKKLPFKVKLAGATCALLLGTTSVYAVPAVQGGGCGLTTANTSTADLLGPNSFSPAVPASALAPNGGLSAGQIILNINPGQDVKSCNFSSLPTLLDMDSSCNNAAVEVDGQTNYYAIIHTNAAPQPTFCLYKYDVNTANADVRTNGAVVVLAPTAVPIFTPLGLLAMMSGLLWFGKRRRKFK